MTTSDEKALLKKLDKADQLGLRYVTFKEPDLGWQITSVAFVPNERVSGFLKGCSMLGSTPPSDRLTLSTCMQKMRKTPQGPGTVWTHGQQVLRKFQELMSGDYTSWPRIEKVTWVEEALRSFKTVYPIEDIYTYCLYHDIGKPFCLTQTDGNIHFPNHAQVSHDIWLQVDTRKHIATWMLHDMDIHTMCREDFGQTPDANLHRLVGLAEVYANAEMFGGYESDSFKIKLKKLIKNGNL
jgi:hypothetical protein